MSVHVVQDSLAGGGASNALSLLIKYILQQPRREAANPHTFLWGPWPAASEVLMNLWPIPVVVKSQKQQPGCHKILCEECMFGVIESPCLWDGWYHSSNKGRSADGLLAYKKRKRSGVTQMGHLTWSDHNKAIATNRNRQLFSYDSSLDHFSKKEIWFCD